MPARARRLRSVRRRWSPAALVVALALAQSRVSLPRVARQVFAGVLVAVVVICCVGGVVRYGSPITRGQTLYDELTAPAPTVTVATSLNNRLLSVSLNDRQYLWHGALKEFHADPVGGGGAGTYADYWLAHRSAPDFVVNAHSLYLEVLGEEGIVGLAVLLVFLAPALVVAVRFRSIAGGVYRVRGVPRVRGARGCRLGLAGVCDGVSRVRGGGGGAGSRPVRRHPADFTRQSLDSGRRLRGGRNICGAGVGLESRSVRRRSGACAW